MRIMLALATVAATVAIGSPAQADTGTEMILSHHRVVLGTDLPHCGTEDQSSPSCIWNVDPANPDGNGEGVAIWVKADGKLTFVWPIGTKLPGGWSWVNGTARYWLRELHDVPVNVSCMWLPADRAIIRCANGKQFVVDILS